MINPHFDPVTSKARNYIAEALDAILSGRKITYCDDLMVVGSSSKSNSVTEDVHQLDAWISGHVQGVFFRAATERVSRQFSVTGRVKNLPDGRVWLYAEGSETEVHAFLSQVCETKKANITSVETETQRGSRKYTEFAVSY